MMISKPPLLILTGPTAVGKTALSIQLAKKIGGEIISADSMQVYRNMDIGSAKITREEMDGIPHHLIDILDPREEFNVVLFQECCKKAMKEIYGRGHIPILTGGTGFYIQGILYDIEFTKTEEDPAYRSGLEALADEKGSAYLHHILEERDPAAAAAIHPNNSKRIIRALEFLEKSGMPISVHNTKEREKAPAYNACCFVMTDDRDTIYRNINHRVDLMMEKGLVEEVEYLKTIGCTKDMVSMQGLGYKEILSYLAGEISLEQAVEKIKQGTRHFAKRQLTWFAREKASIWVDKRSFPAGEDEILSHLVSELSHHGISRSQLAAL
jgi:tRNA dimethylallyltransferase